MKTMDKIFTRRNFLMFGIISLFEFIVGFFIPSLSKAARSGHHSKTGFRNYPAPAPRSYDGSVSLFTNLFWKSLFPPDIPPNHNLPESDAINHLKNLKTENSLTWLGHSTFLIQISGKTILTDPFLTERASPVSWGGPRRFVPPGISVANLPEIDILLVSHNHYDHLDDKTIRQLKGKRNIHVVVPLGLKRFFTQRGYSRISELDWGESTIVDTISLTAHPAVHFSGRGLKDRNKSLWCSWSIISSAGKFYFAGDTGYSSDIFKKIANKSGPFDLAIVPIGAYEPQSIMKPIHTTPEEAIQIGRDIRANIMVASHWGTIELTIEPHWEPPKRFKQEAKRLGLLKDRIWVMKIGETRNLA